jgi:hypothetical protein
MPKVTLVPLSLDDRLLVSSKAPSKDVAMYENNSETTKDFFVTILGWKS